MKGTMHHLTRIFLLPALLCLGLSALSHAAEQLKPFILASTQQGSMQEVKQATIKKLKDAGFTVAGSYSPYTNATIIVVTNDKLKNNAVKSQFGGFGAAQRVSLTRDNDAIQVGFTNPTYMANVYRMQDDLNDVTQQLEKALGKQTIYGSEEGLSKEDLREYHYKFLMPYFTDTLDLAEYPDQATALKKVNEIFSSSKTGVNKVYQIDLPGKKETVIGVHMTGSFGNDCSGDHYIMSRIDFKKIKSTGHLPYEFLISNGKVIALPAEFRIAINFPDLSMMGSNSFASIMCAPNNIEDALTGAAGGELED